MNISVIKYLFCIYLLLYSSVIFALDFNLKYGDDRFPHMILQTSNGTISKEKEVVLDGNSNEASIVDNYNLKCKDKNIEGVRINMQSSTIDGTDRYDKFYFYDEDLNLIYANDFVYNKKIDDAFERDMFKAVCKSKAVK